MPREGPIACNLLSCHTHDSHVSSFSHTARAKHCLRLMVAQAATLDEPEASRQDKTTSCQSRRSSFQPERCHLRTEFCRRSSRPLDWA